MWLASAGRLSLKGFCAGCASGQLDDTACAATFTITASDFAAVFLNNAVTHAQPEADALPDWTRRVERIEDLGRVLHSGSVVGKFNPHIVIYHGCRDSQHSTPLLFHRISRIVNNV